MPQTYLVSNDFSGRILTCLCGVKPWISELSYQDLGLGFIRVADRFWLCLSRWHFLRFGSVKFSVGQNIQSLLSQTAQHPTAYFYSILDYVYSHKVPIIITHHINTSSPWLMRTTVSNIWMFYFPSNKFRFCYGKIILSFGLKVIIQLCLFVNQECKKWRVLYNTIDIAKWYIIIFLLALAHIGMFDNILCFHWCGINLSWQHFWSCILSLSC